MERAGIHSGKAKTAFDIKSIGFHSAVVESTHVCVMFVFMSCMSCKLKYLCECSKKQSSSSNSNSAALLLEVWPTIAFFHFIARVSPSKRENCPPCRAVCSSSRLSSRCHLKRISLRPSSPLYPLKLILWDSGGKRCVSHQCPNSLIWERCGRGVGEQWVVWESNGSVQ